MSISAKALSITSHVKLPSQFKTCSQDPQLGKITIGVFSIAFDLSVLNSANCVFYSIVPSPLKIQGRASLWFTPKTLYSRLAIPHFTCLSVGEGKLEYTICDGTVYNTEVKG